MRVETDFQYFDFDSSQINAVFRRIIQGVKRSECTTEITANFGDLGFIEPRKNRREFGTLP